jgi:ApeA N-terminal domain 1
MALLEERGLFWWHDAIIQEGHFAPEESISGLLTISDNGKITLDLDGVLPVETSYLSKIFDTSALPDNKFIRGILKISNKTVLLTNLKPNGGSLNSNGFSHQKFLAMNAFISEDRNEHIKTPLEFSSLKLDLKGYDDWLLLRSISSSGNKNKITAEYKKPNDISFNFADGNIKITFYVTSSLPGLSVNDFKITEYARLIYTPDEIITLKNLFFEFQIFEDLLILLTNSEYRLNFPFVYDTSNKEFCWYYWRSKTEYEIEPPKHYECIALFPHIKNDFGNIYSNFKKLRKEIGAGVYLYFGTRRGRSLYNEHHFINLMWGLETFHRQKMGSPKVEKLTQKIDRILNVEMNAKDKVWLKNKLKYADEPNLQERLHELISSIPINIDLKKLKIFSEHCAKKRNEISHFGSTKSEVSSSVSQERILYYIEALKILFHALLLHKIGVAPELINKWIYEGFNNNFTKRVFQELDLI